METLLLTQYFYSMLISVDAESLAAEPVIKKQIPKPFNWKAEFQKQVALDGLTHNSKVRFSFDLFLWLRLKKYG